MKRTPLKRRSTKAADVAKARAALRERLGGRCAFSDGCWGGLDMHELVRRSQGGDPTDPRIIILVCRKHHGLDENKVFAESVGMRIPGWLWAQIKGDDTRVRQVVSECFLMRSKYDRTGRVSVPSWYD